MSQNAHMSPRKSSVMLLQVVYEMLINMQQDMSKGKLSVLLHIMLLDMLYDMLSKMFKKI